MKQEIFIILLTGLTWIITLKGRPLVGLLYYQLYVGLGLMYVFDQFARFRIPLVTAGIALISLLFINSKKLFFAPQTYLMVALFGIMCLSRFLNGLAVFGGPYMALYYKIIFAHFLIINLVDSREKLRYYLWIMTITGAVLCVVARYNDSEVPFIWHSKNGFARDLVGLISFPLLFALSEKRWIVKAEAIGYSMLFLLVVVGTNSRGGFIGLGVVLCLILITNFSIKRLLFFIAIILIVFSRVSSQHWERYETISVETAQEGTGGQRLAAWHTAIRMMKANPILGVGTGAFGYNFNRYATSEDQARVGGTIGVTTLNTHNMTLQVGAENGFLGLSLFLLIIFITFKDLIKAFKLCRGDPELTDLQQMIKAIGIALTGFFIVGQVGNAGYDVLFYTLISLAIAASMIAKKTELKDKKNMQGQMIMENIPYQYQFAFRAVLFVIFSYICLPL